MWITMICAFVLANSQWMNDAYFRLVAMTLDSGAKPLVVSYHYPGSKSDFFDGDKSRWIDTSILDVGIWTHGFAIRSEVDEQNHSTFYLAPVDPGALERVLDELDVLDRHEHCAIGGMGIGPGDSWTAIRLFNGDRMLSFAQCKVILTPPPAGEENCLYTYCTSWRRCADALMQAAQAETPGAQVEIDNEELRESVWSMLRRHGMAEWERR